MEYYKVRYQERPEVKVIVEKVDAEESKGMLSTVYSYSEDGKAGSFAIRETMEEAFNALKDSICRGIEIHKKHIEDAEKQLEVISKYEPVINESITKPEPKFKIGDKVIKTVEYRENDTVAYPVLTVVDRLWDPNYESYYYTVTGNGIYDNKIFCEKVLEPINDIYDKLELNDENVTKKDGVKILHSFKVGDIVSDGYDKYIVKQIDKIRTNLTNDNIKYGYLYLVEEPDYNKPAEERIQFWIKEDRLRFWKEPEFKVGDLVQIRQSGYKFRVEKVTLDNFVWHYGWNNPSDAFYETQWVAECNLKLILEQDTKPETEPICGDAEDVKITIDKIIEHKLDEKISNLRNELLDYINELKCQN